MGKHRSYPRLGMILHHDSKGNTKCFQCGKLIERGQSKMVSVDLQWNWFRGDDDVIYLCRACKPRLDLILKAQKEQAKNESPRQGK